jgi:hypothetical protein
MKEEPHEPNNAGNGGDESDDRSPIFYCPLCPGPVYTPYMEHYFKFHPDFPEVRILRLNKGESGDSREAESINGFRENP